MTGRTVGETGLVARYRANYGLGPEVELDESLVRRHWELERQLTEELLRSTPATRAETFERCYTELYQGVPWLREDPDAGVDQRVDEAIWPALIGPLPSTVYEVGSGDGSLARFLAAFGYTIRATEITSERGDRQEGSRLSWGQTDGVHLDRFESVGSFDAVISNQLLEHLHPDDVAIHLRSVRALLRPGGRFAFATPHAYTGPHDISRVFELEAPVGMHLHEYTYGELSRALRQAGFESPASVLRLPHTARQRLGGGPPPVVSTTYLRYLVALEQPLSWLGGRRRRSAAGALRAALFASNIMLVARTPPS